MKKTVTWILLANGEKASVLVNEGPGKGLEAGPMDRCQDLNESREIASDRPGRTNDRAGPGRHAVEPPSDPKEVEKERFLHGVANDLKKSLDRYDRLVVVAPPQALGELRDFLDKEVRNKVHAEIDKDLTKQPRDKLEKQLGEVMAL